MKEIFELIQYLETLLRDYEEGDLLKFLEIKDINVKIDNILSNHKDLTHLIDTKLSEKINTINDGNLINIFFSLNKHINKIKRFIESFDDKQTENLSDDTPNYTENTGIKDFGDYSELIDDADMLIKYTDEVKEHLDNAQISLLDLEYDPTNQENINQVFRCFHTAKSSSAFLGVKNIEEISHNMEDLLVLIRDKKILINGELIDVIFYGIGFIRDIIDVMIINNYNREKIIEIYKKIDIFKYAKMIKKIIKEHQTKKIGEILLEEGKINNDLIDKIINIQKDNYKKFGEIALDEKIITPDELQSAVIKQTSSVKKINYVKVSNYRLNDLVDMVGELVIVQSMIKDMIQSSTLNVLSNDRNITQLENITTNIKNIVLSMGMVPISEIFNKLRIVIRNVSHELGKTIEVDFSGETTELDRNIIEFIYDPLVHIVRNCCDHGIESVEDREKKGKNIIGKISISASHKGSGIEISINDDGRGISKEKIIEKAIKNGLLSVENAKNISDREIYNFIFLPGFSTAEKVSEISGRGVGLDVVKKNIDNIHGKIEIISEKDIFTNFIIKIPLTLAIIDGFVTIVGEKKYIFPFVLINEIIVPKIELLDKMESEQIFLSFRDKHIPLIWAGDFLNETGFVKIIENSVIIVISYESAEYGIIVDKVLGKQEIVIKSLNEALYQYKKVFSGGTIFGDGSIGFVIDIDEFIEQVKKKL